MRAKRILPLARTASERQWWSFGNALGRKVRWGVLLESQGHGQP
ncbi:hypothetical protein PD5205_03348 [Xanthomonas fragariae]|uniref:Uncharacterized protein n=1 Tax=Xanthomonas fragariae TaxID=48664 RepID=A0A1Y6HM95_9XANT|nr:hypothetical protein NBC2815_03529 [Xanthomonas fragariae]SMR04624.1 hypothetical protein PD5205_03348 [Xanthomonas fragariae]